MDRIKELLAKSGCKTELVNSICETMERFKNDVIEQAHADAQTQMSEKIQRVKKICVEETEAHKRELARRVQIFCETKAADIDQQLTKKSALNESQAMTRLKNIKTLLEGVKPNGVDQGRFAAELERATRENKKLLEDRNRVMAEANRKTAIAEKALKQNRALVAENARLREGAVLVESKKPAERRLEPKVKASRPTTTRPTIQESQTRNNRQLPLATGDNFSVKNIAASMDHDLI